jgi:hypothetical protein
MAVTRHSKKKSTAKAKARSLRRKGLNVSINKRKSGYSVTSWRK